MKFKFFTKKLLITTLGIFLGYTVITLITQFDIYRPFIFGGTVKILMLLLSFVLLFIALYLLFALISLIVFLIKNKFLVEGLIIIGTMLGIGVYYYFILLQSNVFNDMIPEENASIFPTFMEYVVMVASVSLPFLLLMLSTRANDTRDATKEEVKYSSYFQVRAVDNSFIIAGWTAGYSRKNSINISSTSHLTQLDKMIDNKIPKILILNIDNPNDEFIEYHSLVFRNVGLAIEKILFSTIRLSNFDDPDVSYTNKYSSEDYVLPSNDIIVFTLKSYELLHSNYSISFTSVNILNIRTSHVFKYNVKSQEFTYIRV